VSKTQELYKRTMTSNGYCIIETQSIINRLTVVFVPHSLYCSTVRTVPSDQEGEAVGHVDVDVGNPEEAIAGPVWRRGGVYRGFNRCHSIERVFFIHNT
jgi:hypothetical protein